MTKFIKKLESVQIKNNSLVCVGLDSDLAKIPKHLLSNKDPIFAFNKKIIDSTCDLVCAYKPNFAFYEAQGLEGIKALKKTVLYIKKVNPDIMVIADAKKGDIGSTNEGYVKAIFDDFKFDAVTVHSYLGKESLKPFLQRKDKAIFIMCRTSNPGACEFQDLMVNHSKLKKAPLYKVVAYNVANKWNKHQNCGLIVGATYPKELKEVRNIADYLPFLIPGIGAQGGSLEKTIKMGQNSKGRGMIINSSRSIIFAGGGNDFAEKARKAAEDLKKAINLYRRD